MSEQRSWFAPTVIVGVGAALVSLIVAGRPWVAGSAGALDSTPQAAGFGTVGLNDAQTSPAVVAVAGALLACWGILLVTRGWVRRLAAFGVTATAIGVVVLTVVAGRTLPGRLATVLEQAAGAPAEVGLTWWYWAGVAGAVLALLPALAAPVLVSRWPAMGRRYDAPEAAPSEVGSETDNLDLWKALDDGRDPTA